LNYTTEATPIGEFTSSVIMTTGSQNEITTDYSITTDAEIASTSLLSTATIQGVANTQLNTNSQEMTSTDKTEHTTETPSDASALSSTTNPVCVCSCVLISGKAADIEAKIKQLTLDLTVNKTLLSSYRRKHVSITDNRPSASYIGYFAGGLIGLFVLVIILCDMTSIIRDFRLLRYRINNEH
jgi:hypothetical protein